MRLAERALAISASPTLAIDAQAKKMAKEGIKVISFGVGEPDFDTPQNIKDAAELALRQGKTKYTPVAGIDELKAAIVNKLKRDNGLDYDPADIVVSSGAKHSLFNVAQVLVNPGDEVILPSPYWVSYEEIIKMAGGIPQIVNTREENDFRLTPAELEAAITPRTRAIILNSPSNPTGSVYTRDALEGLGKVIEKHDIAVVTDEIYEKLIYDGMDHVSLGSLSPALKEKTVLVNGLSKSYSMTGWRIGYIAAPTRIAKAVADFQSHSASNANTFSQWASVEALNGDQGPMIEMVKEFVKRRDYIYERFVAIPGISCRKPNGAFYLFPNVSFSFGKRHGSDLIQDSTDLAAALLKKAEIAVVPGSAFGVSDFIRLSYATSMENIREGLDRFEKFWNELD
ncbi:MAG: pyridoxal phosphate-dependent aminotransferase [Firmicutes bacterium]|nr:pyridoxal phosphate-dependent aminotransferase [Bacillota bacterium]